MENSETIDLVPKGLLALGTTFSGASCEISTFEGLDTASRVLPICCLFCSEVVSLFLRSGAKIRNFFFYLHQQRLNSPTA